MPDDGYEAGGAGFDHFDVVRVLVGEDFLRVFDEGASAVMALASGLRQEGRGRRDESSLHVAQDGRVAERLLLEKVFLAYGRGAAVQAFDIG